MEPAAVLALFRSCGALLEGHFQLSSGLHSPGYLQCALVLQHPAHAEALGRTLAERTRALEATVVLSPALGGVVIGHEVARALGVRALFVERDHDDELKLRRGFQLAREDRVLVVEDVVTTGGSTRATMRVAEAAGAQVVGVAAIINRVGNHVFNVPFETLTNVSLPTYEPSSCPLCAERSPLVKPGSRPQP